MAPYDDDSTTLHARLGSDEIVIRVAICRVVTKAGWGRVCCCSVAELEAEGEPSPYHRGKRFEKLKDAAKSIENKIEIEEKLGN